MASNSSINIKNNLDALKALVSAQIVDEKLAKKRISIALSDIQSLRSFASKKHNTDIAKFVSDLANHYQKTLDDCQELLERKV